MAENPAEVHAALPDEEPVQRFWWLKRLSAMVITGGLLLAVAWIAWDQYSRHEVNRRIKAYADASEPTAPGAYQPAQVPAEGNAAILYMKAANAMVMPPDSPSNSAEEFDYRLPYQTEWIDMAGRAAAANGEAIRLARAARVCREADWGLQVASPPWTGRLPMLSPQRSLANLLVDAALYEHFTGDDASAFADARGVLHQGDAIAHGPFLIGWLVGLGVEALAVDRLQIMATDLRVGSDAEADPDRRVARRADVQQFIAELLDEQPARLRAASTIKWERIFLTEDIPSFVSQGWAIQPAARLDMAALLDRYTAYTEAVGLDSYPAAQARIPARSALAEAVKTANAGFPLGGFGLGNPAPTGTPDGRLTAHGALQLDIAPIPLSFYRHLCERRMLAIMLAFRLYVLDHSGHFPAELGELAPHYLQALPADPFAADGRSFGYFLAEDGRRPILYSVSEDAVDNTRNSRPVLGPGLLAGWQGTGKGPDDQYRDLSAWISPEPRKPFISAAQRRSQAEEEWEPTSLPAVTPPSGESKHDADDADAPGKGDAAQQQDGEAH